MYSLPGLVFCGVSYLNLDKSCKIELHLRNNFWFLTYLKLSLIEGCYLESRGADSDFEDLGGNTEMMVMMYLLECGKWIIYILMKDTGMMW